MRISKQKETVDELLNQVFKLKRLNGSTIIVQVLEKSPSGYYNLKVIKGNGIFNEGEYMAASTNELHRATKVTGSLQ